MRNFIQNPPKLITRSSFWENLFKTPSEKNDLQEVLKSMPPFNKLRSKYLKVIMKLMHNRVYQPNEYIFYQGDPGIGLYIIQEGEVLISQTTEDKGDHKFATLKRGDFFGELAMLDNEVRSASAVSLKESMIAVIFKPDLDAFIDQYPRKGVDILRGISQIITTRLRKLDEDYVALYNKSIQYIEELQNVRDQQNISTD